MAGIQQPNNQVTNSADLTQRFIELVMMNAQQAALCLGQLAHPSTGKAEVNLQAAKMFIDHLEIIREKTKGNLSKDEEKILTSAISELQLAFVHVSGAAAHPQEKQGDQGTPSSLGLAAEEPAHQPSAATESAPLSSDDEGKKRFTKSYGS